jgi:hypothetical protein
VSIRAIDLVSPHRRGCFTETSDQRSNSERCRGLGRENPERREPGRA